MEQLSAALGWVCLTLGALSVAAGIILALKYRNQVVPEPAKPKVGDQGAINDLVKNTTDFAKALKDLDVSGKLLTVGVLLIGIAAITAGLDQVADAIKTI